MGILLLITAGAMADVPVGNAPMEDILGEWQIVEMVYKGKVQDLSTARGGAWIKLEKEHFAISYRGRKFFPKYPCKIGVGELDIQFEFPVAHEAKARYELKDDTLRIIWRDDYGDRPTSFDAVGNPGVTLYVLKRAED